MKIAIAGKGGAGKTTIGGTVARMLARDGYEVVAIDADSNPNLGISLGLGVEETNRVRGVREALAARGNVLPDAADDIVAEFATQAPDGVRLLQVWKLDYFKPS